MSVVLLKTDKYLDKSEKIAEIFRILDKSLEYYQKEFDDDAFFLKNKSFFKKNNSLESIKNKIPVTRQEEFIKNYYYLFCDYEDPVFKIYLELSYVVICMLNKKVIGYNWQYMKKIFNYIIIDSETIDYGEIIYLLKEFNNKFIKDIILKSEDKETITLDILGRLESGQNVLMIKNDYDKGYVPIKDDADFELIAEVSEYYNEVCEEVMDIIPSSQMRYIKSISSLNSLNRFSQKRFVNLVNEIGDFHSSLEVKATLVSILTKMFLDGTYLNYTHDELYDLFLNNSNKTYRKELKNENS